VSAEAIRTMAPGAVVFAMANPTPEVLPEEIEGDVAVIATGRSDYPNQINNVLAFPGVFRGALDVRASTINDEMELAAAQQSRTSLTVRISPPITSSPASSTAMSQRQSRAQSPRLRFEPESPERKGGRMKVKDVMTKDVVTVEPGTPLKDVARLLVDRRVSGVPVVDVDGTVVGVVSEGDILVKERDRQSPQSLLGHLLDWDDGERLQA
jgi:Malic enzyme